MANEKIAVIEDEEILRTLMEEELRKNGYQVESAFDGQAGWELIESFLPDLILLDLLMPVMSGYDVLQKLRADDRFKETPCIVFSNSGQTDDLNRAYACGATDLLIKANFDPEQLVEKVKDYLSVR